MLSSIKEVFAFTKGETIALCILLAVTLIGGGLMVYEQSRQSLPSRLIFEALEAPALTSSDAGQSQPSPAPKAGSAGVAASRLLQLDINSAPAESLRLLPFIGESLSRRIIDFREKNGPFDSVGQLIAVNGIGPKNLQKLRPYLVCRPRP